MVARASRVALSLLWAWAALLAGCSVNIPVVQIPNFYTPELKSVAVVPFRNQTPNPHANEIVSDKLAAALAANGSYKVFNRNDLKALMDQSDLQIAFGADTAAAAEKLKGAVAVQTMVTGAVTTFSATSNSQPKRDPIYAYDRQGNRYIQGYKSYVHTRNEANVYVTCALIRVADGTTLYATSEPVWARSYSEGSPPQKDAFACQAEATDHVIRILVGELAPTRKVVKVNPDKVLRTASELYDNKWTYSEKFKSSDEKMYVVVALPASCDRNRFRLAIVRKDRRQDLASQDITWSKQHAGFGYLFSPRDIAAKGGGPGEYEVKFYSGPEPVMRRAFRIE